MVIEQIIIASCKHEEFLERFAAFKNTWNGFLLFKVATPSGLCRSGLSFRPSHRPLFAAPSGVHPRLPHRAAHPRSFSFHHHHHLRPSLRTLVKLFAEEPKRPKLVLYTTSLRGIRRTFEDCCAVRAILHGLRVAVDERDVSMDVSFRFELQSLLGKGRPLALPQVFIENRWLGGVEEIWQMNEAGELGRRLEGIAAQDPTFVCDGCGGARFVPCSYCHGSQKVFVEREGRKRRCDECNENGLVRCLHCCS
ncbi:glutaredoxin family [Musa troglodytarum]|uniref:Glutaredoxin family n=1 Tax=Musa troglodytarum TaxID=320322 RepID=A0A9E7I375_9LILI|nr:glutaredoxin family [Musa troglodytarum]